MTTANFRTFLLPLPQRNPAPISSHSSTPLCPSSPCQPLIYFLSFQICLLWTFHINGNICGLLCLTSFIVKHMWLVLSDFFHCFHGSFMPQCVSTLHSFLWLYNVPLSKYTTFCLTKVCSWTFELFPLFDCYEQFCYKHPCTSFYVDVFSVLMNIYLGVELLGHVVTLGFPGGAGGKELAFQCRRHKRQRLNPWVGKIPWRRSWQTTPVFLLGESPGQRILVSYSPWGHKESDTTEAT